MKLPRDLSGRQLVRSLERAFGYRQVHQAGSHIIVQTESPRSHRMAVPDHRALRPGTLNAIIRAIAQAQAITKEEVMRRLSP